MKRKLLAIFSSIFLASAVLTGCGSSDTSKSAQTPAPGATDGKPKVAVILKTLSNPFWVAMKDGIEAEAKKQDIKVDIFAAQSEDDTQGQVKISKIC